MLIRIRAALHEYIKENLFIVFICLILFIIGSISGGIMALTLPQESMEEISDYLEAFFEFKQDQNEIDTYSILLSSLGQKLTMVSVIWMLGITIIGIPLVLTIIFLKGLLLGYTVTVLTSQMSFGGFIFSIISLLPHNILFLPAFLLTCIAAISVSITLFKNHFTRQGKNLSIELINYIFIIISTTGITFFASLVEAYITPTFMNLFLNYF